MKQLYCLIPQLFLALTIFSQQSENLPADYLSKEFHASRREALRQLMPPNSVAAIFAYPERTFSEDVSYRYHPNPDLYYFSGYKEPNAVLLIFKEPQTTGDNKNYNELFFIQKRDSASEMWTGRRMGVEKVKLQLGFNMVFEGSYFKNYPVDLSKFDKILFEGLPQGLTDDTNDSADLYDLVKTFKEKAGIPESFNDKNERLLSNFSTYATMKYLPNWIEYIQKQLQGGKIRQDSSADGAVSIAEILNIKDSAALNAFKEKIRSKKINTGLYNQYVGKLREIKTTEEMALMRKVINISCIAHAEAMKAIQPGMSEFDLQGLLEYVHKKYGAEWEGYPPIVGAGDNCIILHYEDNTKTNIGTGLVLMDVGAEYHGFSADVTRTIPSTGKFSPEQRKLYDLVYKAQEEVFKLCKEGTPFDSTENKAKEVLADGLISLGIIKNKEEVERYYPHGCSHFLGLDVHDKGIYDNLLANMVITVEPGIYIPENSPCPKKWWGIGIRIEDDVLIKKNGYELLSYLAPRKSDDVEKMIAKKSVLNDFILPKLPGAK